MPSCAAWLESGAPISPSGYTTPVTMITNTQSTNSGVSTLPMMLTKRVWRMESASTTAKNSAENASMFTESPNNGTMDIS